MKKQTDGINEQIMQKMNILADESSVFLRLLMCETGETADSITRAKEKYNKIKSKQIEVINLFYRLSDEKQREEMNNDSRSKIDLTEIIAFQKLKELEKRFQKNQGIERITRKFNSLLSEEERRQRQEEGWAEKMASDVFSILKEANT